MSNLKSLHDDGYEEFELFMKTQRDFNQKIESQISTNCIEISVIRAYVAKRYLNLKATTMYR